MVVSFVGMAALFIGLNAYFVGIIQILVYAGAIMVLFLFIIMLLDLKIEVKTKFRKGTMMAAILIPTAFLFLLCGVLQNSSDVTPPDLDFQEGASHFEKGTIIHDELTDPKSPSLPDVHLIGYHLFTGYNFPLQIVGVLLLVATVGVVALSRKAEKRTSKS